MLTSPLFVYRVSGGDGKQPPLARDALQLVLTAVVEFDSRARDEVFDGRGDKDLARRGEPGDPGADRDGDPRDLVVVQLALARVQSRAQLQPKLANLVGHRLRAADRPGRAVERGEEAV